MGAASLSRAPAGHHLPDPYNRSPVSTPSLGALSVDDFVAQLASHAPVPGGGSASAVAGALAAALVGMVCELTVGRPDYEEVDPVARQVGGAAADLRAALLAAADEDAAAYQLVVDARHMPRSTDEQKATRKAAIADATGAATEVPLRIARLAVEVGELAATIAPIGNRNAASDAGVAALLAAAAARGAAFNVHINLPYLPADHPLRGEGPARLVALESTISAQESAALAAVRARIGI